MSQTLTTLTETKKANPPGIRQTVRVYQHNPAAYFDRDQCADSLTDSINTLRDGFMRGAV